MARQNRVTPLAEIIAHPGRGLFTAQTDLKKKRI